MTYVLFSIPFIFIGLGIFIFKLQRIPKLLVITGITAVVLMVLTIIFDNLMVWAGLFGFGEGNHLGIMIGRIPIEDLLYPLFAVLLIPALWLPTSGKSENG